MRRAIARTGLLLVAIGAMVRPRMAGFCIVDTSDSGGGAMGCAFAALGFYLLGQLCFAAGSLIPDDGETPPWLLPALEGDQRRLVVAGVALSIGGSVLDAIVSPPITGLFYYLGWGLLIAAWVLRAWEALRPRL